MTHIACHSGHRILGHFRSACGAEHKYLYARKVFKKHKTRDFIYKNIIIMSVKDRDQPEYPENLYQSHRCIAQEYDGMSYL